MSHKLKTLNLAAAGSVVLFYGAAFWMCGFSFNDDNCTDVGLIIAPLFLFPLVLVPLAVVSDIVALIRKLLRRA